MLDLRDIHRPTPYTGEVTVGLDELEWFIARRSIDLCPPYQRGSVWTQEQQERFMGHLLQGGEVLPLIVQRVPDGGPQEVLDGKQRIEAMLAWLAGRIPALLDDGRRVRISDLHRHLRGTNGEAVAGLWNVSLRVRYVNLSWAERVRFYVRLNSAGTPHTREQLEAAMAAKEAA